MKHNKNMHTNKDLIQYMQSKNLSAYTIKRYMAEIKQYNDFLHDKGINAEAAEKKDLLEYLNNPYRNTCGMKKAKSTTSLSKQAKKAILGILNHYYNYLSKTCGASNITRLIKIRGAKSEHLRYLLSSEELEQLCDALYYDIREKSAFSKPTLQQQKDYIILSLGIYQGLTYHHISRLESDDFNFRKATVKIQGDKKSNPRVLPLDASQTGILMQYLQENENPEFLTSLSQLQKLTKKLKTFYPLFEGFSQLRSSRINIWVKTEGLRKAQYLAGHRYISSTENYLKNDFESLKNELDNFHPLR